MAVIKSTQPRRYIVVQDPNVEGAVVVGSPVCSETVVDVESANVTDVIQAEQADAYEEGGLYAEAAIKQGDTTPLGVVTLKNGDVLFTGNDTRQGDVNVTAAGAPEPTYAASNGLFLPAPPAPHALELPPYMPSVRRNDKIKGDGIISTAGSGDEARYTFRKEGQTQWQYRATPNYYGKVPEVLARDVGTEMLGRSYFRPGFCSLKNGNLLSFYINGTSPPYQWFQTSMTTQDAAEGEGHAGDPLYSGPTPVENRNTQASLHLLVKGEMFWSNGRIQTIPGPPVADGSNLGADYYQLTSHDVVQFDDTEEVLYLSAGFLGKMKDNDLYANAFFGVDALRTELDSYDSFYSGGDTTAGVTNDLQSTPRSYNRFKQGNTADTNKPGDISGVTISTIPLDITSQVLPTGRLVCVMATQTQLLSMVSDDRGKTWRGNQVLDLTFGDLDTETLESTTMRQRYASVSSCLDRNGQMVVLLVCNGTGSRAKTDDWNSGTETNRPQSVISLFVTGDGEMFGSEKRLGVGEFTANWDTSTFSAENVIDESVFALSGAVCMTPVGFIHVQVTSLKMGSPCGTHVQWVVTRTLSMRDVASGASGQEVARSIPDVIQQSASPLNSRTHRFVPGLVQYGAENSASAGFPRMVAIFQDAFGYPPLLAVAPAVAGPVLDFGANTQGPNGWIGAVEQCRTGGFGAAGSISSRQNFGGGPIWSNGPIDIEAVLWRGQIVTSLCFKFEDRPMDWPGAYAMSVGSGLPWENAEWPSGEQTYERSVMVVQSGFHQPANVHIPTQLAIGAPLLQIESPSANRVDATQAVTLNAPEAPDREWYRGQMLGNEFGANVWNLSWFAAASPDQQGWWLKSDVAAPSAGYPRYVDSETLRTGDDYKRRYVGGAWQTLADIFIGSNYSYCTFPGGFRSYDSGPAEITRFSGRDIFPNSRGWMLKTLADTTDGTEQDIYPYYTDPNKESLSFVCRAVVLIDYGADYLPVSDTNWDPNMGIKIGLIDEGAISHVMMGLHFYKPSAPDDNKRILYLSGNGAKIANSDIEVTLAEAAGVVTGQATDYARPGWVEVLFGRRESGKVFIAARPWKRGEDPDFLNDYIVPESLDHTLVSQAGIDFPGSPGRTEEYIEFGSIRDAASDRNCLWKSVQFSRSFLDQAECSVDVYAGEASGFPLGGDEGAAVSEEGLATVQEPAMGMFQVNDAGCLSPMRPSLAGDSPHQFVDRGVELAFRGRATSNQTFQYEGKSRFAAASIFQLPTSYGWRGSDTLIAAEVETTGTPAHNIVRYHTPDTDIVFDFGGAADEGVSINALAMFGVTSPAVCVQFTNLTDGDGNPNFADYPDESSHYDDINFFIAPPPDGYMEIGAWAQATELPASANSGCMFLSRYLYYSQYYKLGVGNIVQPLDDPQIRFVIRDNGYVYWGPEQYSSAGVEAPFTPHQLRSRPGENFYLVFYNRERDQGGAIWTGETGHFATGHGAKDRHVLKIEDNGPNWVKVASGDLTMFTTDFSGGADLDLVRVGAAAIMSDRFAFNLPSGNEGSGAAVYEWDKKYRFMRIRIGGCEYHDAAERYHAVSYMTLGRRIDLSNRDFDWGWTIGLGAGNSLITSTTGQRRRRKNHRPRQKWKVSYTPKPEMEIRNQSGFIAESQFQLANGDVINIENPVAGYGANNLRNSDAGNSQFTLRSKTTWTEIVDRVTRIGIGGEVFSLGFDGYNMTNFSGLMALNAFYFTSASGVLRTHAVLSDPKKLVAARCTGYGGGRHEGYQIQERVWDKFNASGPLNETSSIVKIENIEFEEEL
jgi:hypothetical protein